MRLTKDMASLRATALSEIAQAYAIRIDAVLGGMTAIRTRKVAEADRVLNGLPGVRRSLLLEEEAALRGVSIPTLARLIADKAEAEAAELGAIEAERQRAQAAINAAASPIEIESIMMGLR